MLYKVVRVYRNSGRKKTLFKGLTEKEAQQVVLQYETTEKSMVVYYKQLN